MRIGIDAREIQGQMTGIGRHLKSFLKHIEGAPHEYFLYYSQMPENKPDCPKVNIRIFSGQKLIWDHILLPKALIRDKIDLFFSPYYKRPWSLKVKSIITVHDINPLFMKSYSLFYKIYFKTILKQSLKKSDFIVVVSRYVKKQLCSLFNVDPQKIVVNYNSLDENFLNVDESQMYSVLEKYKINSDYILYVGNLMPHKNIPTLIKAYAELSDNIKDKYKLVVGGAKSKTYNQLAKLAGKMDLLDNIIFTGFIDDSDLAYLYRKASLFVFPSFREGFGYPPLEAMASGVPVVASDRTSLPEVIADAGILVSPDDISGFTKAMERVLTDKELSQKLIEQGKKRAKEFSTEKMAKGLVAVFERLSRNK